MTSCKAQVGYQLRKQCDECPWRSDTPTGRFTKERFITLRKTSEQGFNPLFACHKTMEGKEAACVGFLLNQMATGPSNFNVRIALIRERFNPEELVATGPQYATYDEMLKANLVKRKRRDKGNR